MLLTASGLQTTSWGPSILSAFRLCRPSLFLSLSSSKPISISNRGGLDAVWVTCGYLGFLLVLAIVGITLVAKRWIRADTMDQEFGDDYYQNNEFELPPVYSESYGSTAPNKD